MADLYRDFVFTRNTVQVTDTDTTIQVEDVSLFPPNSLLSKSEFYIAFDSTLTYPHFFEIVRLLSVNVATKTLTVQRAQAGTVATAHPIVTYIKGTLNADQVRRLRSGERGTVAPTPDSDIFSVGDRFYHSTEGRFYAFTGNASFLRDTFTRAASATTMGSTETQTVVGEINTVLAPQVSQVVPYTATWTPSGTSIFGINASNQAYLVSGVAGSNCLVNVGSTNFDVTFDVFMSTTAGSDYGIFFRVSADGLYGYYLGFTGTTANLFRVVNGVFTSITTTTYATNAIRTWRVWVDGNRIRILRPHPTNNTIETAIDYTETTTGFLVGNAVYRPGGGVGFRYGNAAAVADTAIVWDNFTCTHPDNLGLNNPKPQGWAPVSSLLGPLDTSGYTMRQLAKIESDMSTLLSFTEDLHDITRSLETSQAQQSRDIATIGLNLDEWLDVYRADAPADPIMGAVAGVAATVDEIIDILGTLIRSGTGTPTGTPRDAELFVDTSTKSLFVGVGGVWTRVTYAGPNATIPVVTYVGTSSTSNSTISYPAGTSPGDLAFAYHNTANTSDSNIQPPTGWTRIANGAPVSQYYNAFSLAYKVLTQADISNGSAIFNDNTSGNTQTQVRVYRNAGYGAIATSTGTAANNTTLTGPTIATTVGQTVINWFTSANNNHNPDFLAPAQSNVVRQQQGFAWQNASDEIATGTTSTARQARYTTGDNASAWAFHAITLVGTGEIIPTPGAVFITGLPVGSAVTGSIRIDQNSNAVYVYNGTEWIGVNRRVVLSVSDYAAKGSDYILANTTASGRSATVAEYDTHSQSIDSSNPTTRTFTTTKPKGVVVGLRATWQGSGFTATLNGAPMTLRRRQYSQFATNSGPDSSLFTSDTVIEPGSHSVVFSGATNFGIAWASAVVFANCTTVGATYNGQGNSGQAPNTGLGGTIQITLPTGNGGMVYLYNQVNGGSPPSMSNGGGLTWTARGSSSHGSQNASTQWTAPYNAAQAGTTITVVTSSDGSWQSVQAAAFPSSGDPTVYDPGNYAVITLPTNARGAQVAVQNNDQAGNEIRVVAASGTINGAAQDVLSSRYLGGLYTSDGTNWFKLASGGGGGGGSSATVTSKTANYTAKTGEIVLMDASTGVRTVTLPTTSANLTVTVKKTDSSANAVTVVPASGLVDGQANVSILQQYDSYDLVCDGTNWWLV